MTHAGEVEELIAHNAMLYDLMPYESKPFPQSQPARLAAMAKIFGLSPKPLATARVLELGSAAGGNIIPLAMQYPASEFIGVDLSRKQVAAGRARVEKLGLKNMKFLCQSFTELDDTLGQFDYIICHGVFSWVPKVVQDSIFANLRQRLAPQGVGFVSYNVLPGWRMIQPIRDAFLSLVPPRLDVMSRVREAVDLADFIAKATPDQGPYGQILKNWATRLKSLPVDYLSHEFLEDSNDPCTFSDFARRASAGGLCYLGDCDLATMIPQQFPEAVAAEMRQRSGNEIVATEQMMDLLSGRTFRQSLLVHQERVGEIRRELSPACLDHLHLLGSTNAVLKTEDKKTNYIVGNRSFEVRTEPMKAALEKFVSLYPATARVADLIAKPAELEDVRGGFYHLLLSGAIGVLAEPIHADSGKSKQPRAAKLALRDAELSQAATTNLRHEYVTLDAASRFLLSQMQGQKSREQLARDLGEEGRSGRIIFFNDGKQVAKDEAEAHARKQAEQLLQNLAKAALLVA